MTKIFSIVIYNNEVLDYGMFAIILKTYSTTLSIKSFYLTSIQETYHSSSISIEQLGSFYTSLILPINDYPLVQLFYSSTSGELIYDSYSISDPRSRGRQKIADAVSNLKVDLDRIDNWGVLSYSQISSNSSTLKYQIYFPDISSSIALEIEEDSEIAKIDVLNSKRFAIWLKEKSSPRLSKYTEYNKDGSVSYIHYLQDENWDEVSNSVLFLSSSSFERYKIMQASNISNNFIGLINQNTTQFFPTFGGGDSGSVGRLSYYDTEFADSVILSNGYRASIWNILTNASDVSVIATRFYAPTDIDVKDSDRVLGIFKNVGSVQIDSFMNNDLVAAWSIFDENKGIHLIFVAYVKDTTNYIKDTTRKIENVIVLNSYRRDFALATLDSNTFVIAHMSEDAVLMVQRFNFDGYSIIAYDSIAKELPYISEFNIFATVGGYFKLIYNDLNTGIIIERYRTINDQLPQISLINTNNINAKVLEMKSSFSKATGNGVIVWTLDTGPLYIDINYAQFVNDDNSFLGKEFPVSSGEYTIISKIDFVDVAVKRVAIWTKLYPFVQYILPLAYLEYSQDSRICDRAVYNLIPLNTSSDSALRGNDVVAVVNSTLPMLVIKDQIATALWYNLSNIVNVTDFSKILNDTLEYLTGLNISQISDMVYMGIDADRICSALIDPDDLIEFNLTFLAQVESALMTSYAFPAVFINRNDTILTNFDMAIIPGPQYYIPRKRKADIQWWSWTRIFTVVVAVVAIAVATVCIIATEGICAPLAAKVIIASVATIIAKVALDIEYSADSPKQDTLPPSRPPLSNAQLCATYACPVDSDDVRILMDHLGGYLDNTLTLDSSFAFSEAALTTSTCNERGIIIASPDLNEIFPNLYSKTWRTLSSNGQQIKAGLFSRTSVPVITEITIGNFPIVSRSSIVMFADKSVLIGWSVQNGDNHHLILEYFLRTQTTPMLFNIPINALSDFRLGNVPESDNAALIAYTDPNQNLLYIKRLVIVNNIREIEISVVTQAFNNAARLYMLNADLDGSVTVQWYDSATSAIWASTYPESAFIPHTGRQGTAPVAKSTTFVCLGTLAGCNPLPSKPDVCKTEADQKGFFRLQLAQGVIDKIVFTSPAQCDRFSNLAGEGGANAAVKIMKRHITALGNIIAFGKSIQKDETCPTPWPAKTSTGGFKQNGFKSIATVVASYLQLNSFQLFSNPLKSLKDLTFIQTNKVMIPPLYVNDKGNDVGTNMALVTRSIRVASMPIVFAKLSQDECKENVCEKFGYFTTCKDPTVKCDSFCLNLEGCMSKILELSPESVAAYNLLQLITGGGDFGGINVGVLGERNDEGKFQYKLDKQGKKILFKQDLDQSFMWYSPATPPTYPCSGYTDPDAVYDPALLKWNIYKAWLVRDGNILFPSSKGSNGNFHPTTAKPTDADQNFECPNWFGQGQLGFCTSTSMPFCINDIRRNLIARVPIPTKTGATTWPLNWCDFLIDVLTEMDMLRIELSRGNKACRSL